MEMYRLRYDGKIEKIEIIKRTAKTVLYKRKECYGEFEERELLKTLYSSWHDTFEDARQFFIKNSNGIIDELLKKIDYHKERIKKIETLEPF